MINRTLSRGTIAALATATAVAVLSPAAQAAPAAARTAPVAHTAAALPAHLTVDGYQAYLKKNWAKGGRETSAAFKKLTPAQKKKFLLHLEDRKIYLALHNTVKGNVGHRLHTVNNYNQDVQLVTDVTSRIAGDKVATATLNFTATERIYGIPVTTETVTVSFETRGHAKNKNAHAKVTLKNVNAAIALKASKPTAVSKGTITNGATVWTATPQVRAFGKKVVKDQLIQAAITKTGKFFNARLTNR
ncbi:hypothetical protein ACGFY7_24130 [Streptomyces prunicolor]|uniref:hypothetical protein n=1 Tax=Streptomyces prunicolor TaxID=67348 RepID=UPI0037100BB3